MHLRLLRLLGLQRRQPPHDGVMGQPRSDQGRRPHHALVLAEVAPRHASAFVFRVMDPAGWYVAGAPTVPDNMRQLFLPPYSPALDPADHLREAIHEGHFANHVFEDLNAVEHALTRGLVALQINPARTRSTS